MKYIVKRSAGKKVPNVLKDSFLSYDEARSAVRKWLRAQAAAGKIEVGYWDRFMRTVSIGKHGFSIVAA